MSADQKLTLRLLILPYLLGLLDVAVTLHYQSGGYWQGNYAEASDGNPLVLLALRIHPLLMIPGTFGWFAIGWFLLCHTASWIALRAYVILLTGHTIGAGGWLFRYHPQGIILYTLLVVAVTAAGYWVIRPYLRFWSEDRTLRHAFDNRADIPTGGLSP